MTWDTVWNILKLTGSLVGLAALVTLCAKVWSSTTKDKIISLLETELDLARQHTERCDLEVVHYREEMHQVRGECQADVTKHEAALLAAREKLKVAEVANAGLLAKTDLSPVMESLTGFIKEQRNFTKEQTEINAQVLEALKRLTSPRLEHAAVSKP